MGILLYAEHLVHIRTLSIQADLPSDCNEETRAILSDNGESLKLVHNGEVAELRLPTKVPSRGNGSQAGLSIPTASSNNLSFRIPLPHSDDSENALKGALDDAEAAPWGAAALGNAVEIRCQKCETILVSRGAVQAWKDLPSENWAEMMDFWHCHRPHVPHSHDASGASTKGYSADSRLALHSSVGMVDPVAFVLLPDDCINIMISPGVGAIPGQPQSPHLECATCRASLGQIHSSSEGYKLRKANLALSTSSDHPLRRFDSEKWTTCLLLSAVATQGVRKFLINSTLELWVFTPDLVVSASNQPPVRVAKILWREVPQSENVAQGDVLTRETLAQGIIEIGIDEIRSLKSHLIASAYMLPAHANMFQDWRVALLQRFEHDEP